MFWIRYIYIRGIMEQKESIGSNREIISETEIMMPCSESDSGSDTDSDGDLAHSIASRIAAGVPTLACDRRRASKRQISHKRQGIS